MAHKIPLVLAVVCSRWRQIVLDMPSLWINLVLTRHLRTDALQDVQTLLARAGLMPRSLTLLTRKRPVMPTLVHDLLAPYRYHRLSLCLHRDEVESLAALLTQNPQWTSELRELALYKCHKSQFTHFTLFPPDAQLSEMSSLKLKVYQPIDAQFLARAHLWHNMRHLHLSTKIAARSAFEILRHCHATLEMCHLVSNQDATFATWVSSLTESITLPHLRTLAVTFYDGHDVVPFIQPLVLPHLVSLSLFSPFSEEIYLSCDASLFTHLTQRSNGMPHIEAVHIDRADDPVDMDVMLRAMPSLIEITLDPLSPLEEDALNEMVTGQLGPRLERLYVGSTEEQHEADLHRMEQGRNRYAQSINGSRRIPQLHLEFLPL
ncbi:hypothetical protein APHAL10511_006557 [Amanita phalloides]|nr:hypothetical protein APHAL10511_006557 [Amanita phalloides]